jgi:predicted Zn-ribbon and HTH transcriptional regulator
MITVTVSTNKLFVSDDSNIRPRPEIRTSVNSDTEGNTSSIVTASSSHYKMTITASKPGQLRHDKINNSSDTIMIPARDGRSVMIQQTLFPMEHKECGYYWLTSSRKRLITCPGCKSTISRQKNLTILRETADHD